MQGRINTDGLREYIEVFLATLRVTAAKFLPDHQSELRHLSLLPARIIGYVSAQNGVAFEYVPAAETAIETRFGTSRIEDFVLAVPSHLHRAQVGADVSGASNCFERCGFTNLRPLRLSSESASVTLRDVTCSSESWKRHVHYAELYGTRDSERWSRVAALASAKDEVLAALTSINVARRRNHTLPQFISAHKRNMVLLLGDYGIEGHSRLDRIRATLCELGYEPVTPEDVPDLPEQHLTQKVLMLGSLARFVVVDDSSKSGHLSEIDICHRSFFITALVRAKGQRGSWMTARLDALSSVMKEIDYDPDDIAHGIKAAVAWAEAEIRRLKRTFDGTYPWR